MKKLIGKLKVNINYEVISIDYRPKGDFFALTSCSNCGKPISNIATIQDADKNIFNVGLDCAATMSLYQKNEVFDLIQAKKTLAKKAKFVRFFKKECKAFYCKNDEDTIFFYDKTDFKMTNFDLDISNPCRVETFSHFKKWNSRYIYRMGLTYFKENYPFLILPKNEVQ